MSWPLTSINFYALFRYGLIADLVQLPPGSKGLYARIAKIAGSRLSAPSC